MKKMLLLALFLIASPAFSSTEYRITNGHGLLSLSCASWSMSPAFTCYDNLTAEYVKQGEILPLGTIAVYQLPPEWRKAFTVPSNTGYIIHRVVGRGFYNGKLYYLFKGDNNTANDFIPVQSRFVILKVTRINGGKV